MNCLPKVVTAAFLTCAFVSGDNLVGKLPDHVKLIQGISRSREAPASENISAPEAKPEQLLRRAQQAARARCAHIIVYRADPHVDPGIHIRAEGPAMRGPGNMPFHPGLPVCPEDVRQPAPTPGPPAGRVPNGR